MPTNLPEPWLRGTLTDVPAVLRGVLHALDLAEEDIERYCGGLTTAEMHARPLGLASVAFHVRHIARSSDRLLTYAEGRPLAKEQMALLGSESDTSASREEVFTELRHSLSTARARVQAFDVTTLDEARRVGRQSLSTTVGGLLIHVADHTQRHVGQAITTSKVVLAQRDL